MTALATDVFFRVGPGVVIPNNFVVPRYLDDRKLRIAIARFKTEATRSTISAPVPTRDARQAALATAGSSGGPGPEIRQTNAPHVPARMLAIGEVAMSP
jgi:hypothetical protein